MLALCSLTGRLAVEQQLTQGRDPGALLPSTAAQGGRAVATLGAWKAGHRTWAIQNPGPHADAPGRAPGRAPEASRGGGAPRLSQDGGVTSQGGLWDLHGQEASEAYLLQ